MILLSEQLVEAERELALRRKLYPQWVQSGRLDPRKAQYQLACMEAITLTLTRLFTKDVQLSLLGTEKD
jgi:hypothetical protein